jgi:hypothetical protein
MKSKFVAALAGALFFSESVSPSQALTFQYSFTNNFGNVSGTVSGVIEGVLDNSTSPATAFYINSYPAGLAASGVVTPFEVIANAHIFNNSFTVVNGAITATNFLAGNDVAESVWVFDFESPIAEVFALSHLPAEVGHEGAATFSLVAETPLPAALPLFATGLGALGLIGWRRKKKTAALAA